jgi:hypothetical protein
MFWLDVPTAQLTVVVAEATDDCRSDDLIVLTTCERNCRQA